MRNESGQVSRDGVAIHYEVEGQGPAVLLHHGFTSGVAQWRAFGYFDALRDGFTLVALDALGHGESDKPHDPALYTMERRAGDVAAVLDAAGFERADYWGYSMGGRTGFGMLQHHPERVHRFVNGAAGGFSPKHFEAEGLRKRAAAFAAGSADVLVEQLGTAPEFAKRIMEQNDGKALAASSLGLAEWEGFDASECEVASLHYVGESDVLRPVTERAAARMKDARLELLPGVGHLGGFARSDLALPAVRDFLR